MTGMIESGDFKIDLDERTVTLRGRELELTSEEFDVLMSWPAIIKACLPHAPCWRQVGLRVDLDKPSS